MQYKIKVFGFSIISKIRMHVLVSVGGAGLQKLRGRRQLAITFY